MDSGYSVIMPDNYVVVYKVKSLAKQAEVLQKAQETTERILWAIQQQKRGFFRVKKGKLGSFLALTINPIFQKHGTKTKYFNVTSDCIGCGICEKVCTDACIQLKEGTPVWTKEQCNMCMACVNRCPKGAIEYGKMTKGKGRYIHPCWK